MTVETYPINIDMRTTSHGKTGTGPTSPSPGSLRSAPEFLMRAAELVSGDRAEAHGDMHVTCANTARLMQAWLDCKAAALSPHGEFRLEMDARDTVVFNIFQKMCRDLGGAYNPDDWQDICGYGGMGGEIRAREAADDV